MTHSASTVAAIRFGFGLRPGQTPPAGAAGLLQNLTLPPANGPSERALTKRFRDYRKTRDAGRKAGDRSGEKAMQAALRQDVLKLALVQMERAIASPTGFEERLVRFWADHFTVEAQNFMLRLFKGHYVEAAIRPNIAGSFGDLLVAAVTHPAMLVYLNQASSLGPNSPAAKRQRKRRGLNENLAREVLELHTLGVGGDYAQRDVRQLAEVLTGLTLGREQRAYRPRWAEPGAEEVLGRVYSPDASQEVVEEVLHDIARHPDTARHIARKLAVHFVSDAPEPALVAHIEAAYLASGGELAKVYAAMLEHPASWAPLGGKVKQPYDLLVSGYRALDLSVAQQAEASGTARRYYRRILRALTAMGQQLHRPGGPDGWPEDARHWVTPAAMAARIDWASWMASQHGQKLDPRRFARDALADAASPRLRALAAGAEVKWEGVALVLASPEFNRR